MNPLAGLHSPIVMMAFAVFAALQPAAQAQVSEYELKAAFISNFLQGNSCKERH